MPAASNWQYRLVFVKCRLILVMEFVNARDREAEVYESMLRR